MKVLVTGGSGMLVMEFSKFKILIVMNLKETKRNLIFYK